MGMSERGAVRGLVGRATELAQLRRVFQEIREGREGRGRLVTLTGATGIGKTALAQSFLGQIRAQDPRVIALTTHCVEHQTAYRPYGPFRDILAELTQAGGDAGLSSLVRKAAPGWLPDAAQAPGRPALFDQFLALCRAILRARPLVLAFDDLQWSDRSSLDLLARLGSALGSLPALIVVTYESVAPEQAPAVKEVQHRAGASAMELVVRGLEREAILELAGAAVGGQLANELGEWIVDAAQGNPLRAEHYARWLLEEKIIRKGLRRFKVREGQLPSPAKGIDEVVAARLDRLEPSLRWTLEAAAFGGSVIDSAVVAHQAGKREEEILAELRVADAKHGLLDGIGDRRWASGSWSARFRFRHPRVRQVIRERVSGKRRIHLTTRAAEALERLMGDGATQIAGELAALYLATESSDKIHEWTLKAADLSDRLFAVYEVDDYLRAAARTTRAESERLRIESRLATIYGATGREPEAEALAESVYDRARQAEDRETMQQSGTMLGWLRLERGVPPLELASLAGGLVDAARSAELPEELVQALDLSCVVAERLGRAEEALLMAEESLHVAEQSGSAEMVAQAAYRLARVHLSWGSPEEGRRLAERALDVFAQMDDMGGVAVCHDLLGLANFRAGDWEQALHHWESALENMEVAGIPDEKIAMQVNIAELLTLRGEFDRALGLFKSGLRLAEELDDEALARRCRTGIARLEFERGAYGTVLELTEEIRQFLPDSGAWRDDFQTTAIRALSYLELGDELQAWQEAARLEQLYRGKEGWFARRAEGDAVRIRVIDLDSDAWLAGMVAKQSIGETVDKDPYGEAFLQYHRACVLARAKPGEARKAAERAVQLFGRLGANPMLRRARELRDEMPPEEYLDEAADATDSAGIDKWFESYE